MHYVVGIGALVGLVHGVVEIIQGDYIGGAITIAIVMFVADVLFSNS